MTVLLERRRLIVSPGLAPAQLREEDKFGRPQHAEVDLTIGLVNNMPDAALKATERQFMRLLRHAAGDIRIDFHCFSLPSVHRSQTAKWRVDRQYTDIADLGRLKIDGLIVTGAEPIAATLARGAVLAGACRHHRLGGNQHALDDLVVPCRARRGAASRRHRAAAACRKMFRHLRLRQGRRHWLTAGRPLAAEDPAFAPQRTARKRTGGAWLPNADAIARGRRRYLRQEAAQPVRVLPGTSRI